MDKGWSPKRVEALLGLGGTGRSAQVGPSEPVVP